MTAMQSSKTLKDTYIVEKTQKSFYNGGGVIQITSDAKYIVSQCTDCVTVLNTSSGEIERKLREDDDPGIKSLVLYPNDEMVAVAYDQNLLKIWDWKTGEVRRTWKSLHTGPIQVMAMDPSSTLLATGSVDTTVKVWDVEKRYYTHNLRPNMGAITAMSFRRNTLQLITAALDMNIRLWDLETSECLWVTAGHYSQISSLTYDPSNADILISAGRDSVLLVWDLVTRKRIETVPVYEAIEEIVAVRGPRPAIGVNDDDLHVITAGNKGILRVWNVRSKNSVHTCDPVPGSTTLPGQLTERSLSQLKLVPTLGQICSADRDGNIRFYGENTLTLIKQYAGDNDEIYDVALFGFKEEYLALASNSSSAKVYQLDNMDSDQLHGHDESILSISVSFDGQLLLTGSKDGTAILWKLGDGIHNIQRVYRTPKAEKAVTATAFSSKNSLYMLTATLNATLNVWRTTSGVSLGQTESSSVTISCTNTITAHNRQIEYIDVAPNGKLIVTASQDKTAKVWSQTLSLAAILKGHTRAVSCAKFSPVDQCVLTASYDGTVKIFALSNYSCIKTFQGHESPVINISFATRGMQFLSSDDNGLVKLWTIKENECVDTFVAHEGTCWALYCSRDSEKRMITGGSDSMFHIWKDVTEEKKKEAREKQNKELIRGQQLSNLIQEKRYHEALCLALTMEKPFNCLTIVQAILRDESEETLYETLEKLNLSQTGTLLRFCMLWNTNSKTCHEAQILINQVLRIHSFDAILSIPTIQSILEGTLPYTERHYQRMNRLVQSSQFVDYTWSCFKLSHVKLEPESESEEDMVSEEGDVVMIQPKLHETKPKLSESDSGLDSDDQI